MEAAEQLKPMPVEGIDAYLIVGTISVIGIALLTTLWISAISQRNRWRLLICTLAYLIAALVILDTVAPMKYYLHALPLVGLTSLVGFLAYRRADWASSENSRVRKKLLLAFIIVIPVLHYAHFQFKWLTRLPTCSFVQLAQKMSNNPDDPTFWEQVFGVPSLMHRPCVSQAEWEDKYRNLTVE